MTAKCQRGQEGWMNGFLCLAIDPTAFRENILVKAFNTAVSDWPSLFQGRV